MAVSFRCDCRSALRLLWYVQPTRPELQRYIKRIKFYDKR
jgi:hypothetical protein